LSGGCIGDGAGEGVDDDEVGDGVGEGILAAKKAISPVATTAMATSKKMLVLNKNPSFVL